MNGTPAENYCGLGETPMTEEKRLQLLAQAQEALDWAKMDFETWPDNDLEGLKAAMSRVRDAQNRRDSLKK